MRSLILTILLALMVMHLFTGCASVHFDVIELGGDEYRQPSEQAPVVYGSGEEVTRPFRRIAIINASNGGNNIGFGEMVREIRAKAQEMGADAIVLGGSQTRSAPIMLPLAGGGFLPTMVTGSAITAHAIVFTDSKKLEAPKPVAGSVYDTVPSR